MARTTFPRALLVHEVGEDYVPVVFRIVKARAPDEALFDASFRSNYELRRPPRNIEERSAALHMGLSMYDSAARAASVALRYRRIGEWIARVRLNPGHGFGIARTGPRGHFTVWGRPEQLKLVVTGTVHIDDFRGPLLHPR